MPHNSIADDIAKIKDVLLTRGRITGILENDEGEVCLLGAACVANGITTRYANIDPYGDVMNLPVAQFLSRRIDPAYDPDPALIYGLNDRAESDSEVFDFLDEAQIAAKEQARDGE